MSPINAADMSRRAVLKIAGAAAAVSASAGASLSWAASQAEPPASSGPAAPLDEREIPGTGVKIPSVGLGTSRQFDVDLADEDAVAELKQTLQRFLDLGGTVVDSSPMYGRAEQVVGRLSTDLGINDKLWLATKVWTQRETDGEGQMRRSIGRLGREKQLELMQVHNLVDVDEHLKTLRAWKDQGTFRHIGVTHYTRESLEDLERYATNKDGATKVDFIQLPYNIEMRAAEERLFPLCRDNGVATLINVPFGNGGLFGRVKGKPLPAHARRYAGTWAQAFLKFILANDAVTCVIPGTSDPKHVEDNCGAMRGPLPTAEECKQLIAEVE